MNHTSSSNSTTWLLKAREEFRKLFSPGQMKPADCSVDIHTYDPFEREAESHDDEAKINSAETTEQDETVGSADVTDATLSDMSQQKAHSLDRDIDDPFFWREARPDAVAGMAKVYLKARCPTPYWRTIVSSNSYALWGAVAMSRIVAQSMGEPCSRAHLAQSALLSTRAQAELLRRRPVTRDQLDHDLARAEGLALPGMPFGDCHKHAALRVLFYAMTSNITIEWPDLPERLGIEDVIPQCLPGLEINRSTLSATIVEVDRTQSEKFWLDNFECDNGNILMVPDWASWMLVNHTGHPFAKIPGF